MVSQGRFELPTFPLGGGCSIQLSYWDTDVVTAGHGATDGVHVNGQPLICHVVRGLFKCRQAPCNAAGTFTVQFALPQKAIIADCNLKLRKNPCKSLFLKDFTPVRLLARRLLCLFS